MIKKILTFLGICCLILFLMFISCVMVTIANPHYVIEEKVACFDRDSHKIENVDCIKTIECREDWIGTIGNSLYCKRKGNN